MSLNSHHIRNNELTDRKSENLPKYSLPLAILFLVTTFGDRFSDVYKSLSSRRNTEQPRTEMTWGHVDGLTPERREHLKLQNRNEEFHTKNSVFSRLRSAEEDASKISTISNFRRISSDLFVALSLSEKEPEARSGVLESCERIMQSLRTSVDSLPEGERHDAEEDLAALESQIARAREFVSVMN